MSEVPLYHLATVSLHRWQVSLHRWCAHHHPHHPPKVLAMPAPPTRRAVPLCHGQGHESAHHARLSGGRALLGRSRHICTSCVSKTCTEENRGPQHVRAYIAL